MNHWKAKLAAWLHDPAEKALVLLRDKQGHEWGTVADLREQIFGTREMPADIKGFVKRADWYASAADRPQWPLDASQSRYAAWTQVDFAKKPIIRHPLTDTEYDLEGLQELDPQHIKAQSRRHFERYIVRDGNGSADIQRTLLAYWRFGSRSPDASTAGGGDAATSLTGLWQVLPADTRVPDHTIWTHLDLVSSLAGAMAADATGTPALLSLSLGPVQGFIADSRTTSDLWAGSHLLARIAWEAMKVLCEELGPDSILFPRLRGVPIVDVWLRDDVKLDPAWFAQEDWTQRSTDSNPLFAATLPNRLVAIVPADQAAALAARITESVRAYVRELGDRALDRILEEVGVPRTPDLPAVAQIADQLEGFPEVHWVVVPWSLAEGQEHDGKRPAAADGIRQALEGFFPPAAPLGFLDDAWPVLSKAIDLEGVRFFEPNPGVLFPALYDLADRAAAATKAVRVFGQLEQHGYRSSLNGEREWLTLDRTQLDAPPGKRHDSLWAKLAAKKPSWARKGEHLDALSAIKRLWPTLFADEVKDIVGVGVRRYVVSTHSMAIAVSLDQWLSNDRRRPISDRLENLLGDSALERCALPRRIAAKLYKADDQAQSLCQKLPSLLDRLKEQAAAEPEGAGLAGYSQADADLLYVETEMRSIFEARPEAYYGLLLLDGDRMGAWLSGTPWVSPDGIAHDDRLRFEDSWHPQIRENETLMRLRSQHLPLDKYLSARRPASPGRNIAISEALNHFSSKVARFVVEEAFKGKLIYSGGDDVLAMVCTDDLLPAMALLRCLYSGLPIPGWLRDRIPKDARRRVKSRRGWVHLDGTLSIAMGDRASASCGAVIAHHQAPLQMVLRQLRDAESAAKNRGGRDAFCLRILKRAGGEIGVTDKWFRSAEALGPDAGPDRAAASNSVELLEGLRTMLAGEGVSRRASYHSLTWLSELPMSPDPEMLEVNLAYQFARQGGNRDLARDLARYASTCHPRNPAAVIADFLMTAEFLARETRSRLGAEATAS